MHTKTKSLLALATTAGLAVLIGCAGETSLQPSFTESFNLNSAGGTFTFANGRFRLDVPANAVQNNVQVTVRGYTVEHQTGHVRNTGISFSPEAQLNQNATLRITYNPADLPPGANEANLVLSRLTDNGWVEVVGSTVDINADQVSGLINQLDTYAIRVRTVGSTGSTATGTTATGTTSTASTSTASTGGTATGSTATTGSTSTNGGTTSTTGQTTGTTATTGSTSTNGGTTSTTGETTGTTATTTGTTATGTTATGTTSTTTGTTATGTTATTTGTTATGTTATTTGTTATGSTTGSTTTGG